MALTSHFFPLQSKLPKPNVFCNKCLNSYSCPNCSINLVYHRNKNNLLCHYCGFKTSLERKCEKDGDCNFRFTGPGVERISDEVKKNFPSKKIEIFSSDTMNKKSSKDKLEKIVNNEIEILVGTQLISKGFHFPNLNCIVVVDIDLSSQGHDLRGAEKNLQLYHQLSGRAGRTGQSSTVYFQTYNYNTKMISDITDKNPEIFLDKEVEIRKKNNLLGVGFLTWDGQSKKFAQLDIGIDIRVNIGDSIFSSKGIYVGKINEIKPKISSNGQKAQIMLGVDFKRIDEVYILKDILFDELNDFQK